jgi:predicted ribosome quality control (RQC) complex YloA/Tae2 family protein
MRQMSNIDIFAIIKDLQGLIGYRVDNLYLDISDRFFLFKMKGKGKLKNPFLLIEPGSRIHLTEFKHAVPELPSDKIMALRGHLKGALLESIRQVDFDRVVELVLLGKQHYHVFIELFGNRPNFVVVGDGNRVIYASWYRKMRHRDVLPGKEFQLPPSRGKSILEISATELEKIINLEENQEEQIVKVLARNYGGGGALMEELLARASIPKDNLCNGVQVNAIETFISVINEITLELEESVPNISLDSLENPISFQPYMLKSNPNVVRNFENFSSALDFFYSADSPVSSPGLNKFNQKKTQLEKVMKAQKEILHKYEIQEGQFKKIGDMIYQHFTTVSELISTILNARKNNIGWEEIEQKMSQAKKQGISSAQIFKKINHDQGTVILDLDSTEIDLNFRLSTTEIANEYYEKAKKAGRKLNPAIEAIEETRKKIDTLSQDISEQTLTDSITLKRRKRKWFEKYHWTITSNGFLIIGGKDIGSNDEIAKKRLQNNDLFFHAEVQGAPYTVLVRESSDVEITDEDIKTAAQLAASYSSAWKAGYGAIDIYYVNGENVGFTAPSGEYIPKGGIMVRGTRNYIRGTELKLAIGFEESEYSVKVIYGAEKHIAQISPTVVLIKPGNTSKGKVAKQIQKAFLNRASNSEQKAKLRALDFNEIVQAIPHDSSIKDVISVKQIL